MAELLAAIFHAVVNLLKKAKAKRSITTAIRDSNVETGEMEAQPVPAKPKLIKVNPKV